MEDLDRETLLGLAERPVYRIIYNFIFQNKRVETRQIIEELSLTPNVVYKRTKELKGADLIDICRKPSRGRCYYLLVKDNGASKEFKKMIKRFEKKEQT